MPKQYTCPGIAMPQPKGAPFEGYVACYRAGHVCQPPVATTDRSHGRVTTTMRCPCCGEFYGAMTVPDEWTEPPNTHDGPGGKW